VVVLAPTATATAECGERLARFLRPGDTVLLGGDLGAGKTTFTQGLARGLGVEGPVTSPTFVLVHSYPTRAGWDLLHADVWRLEQLQEVIDLAIPELLEDGAVAVIEWGERAAPALLPDCLRVTIGFAQEGTDGAGGARRLQFCSLGPGWASRMGELKGVFEGQGSFESEGGP
jgi:tRNA threonylcarbamoyladenosine biosynthesis protein TsaE